jgi:xanthine dehydrogenase accessory factor
MWWGVVSVWIDPAPDKAALVAAYEALLVRPPTVSNLLSASQTVGCSCCDHDRLSAKLAPDTCWAWRYFRATIKFTVTIGFDVTGFSPDMLDDPDGGHGPAAKSPT